MQPLRVIYACKIVYRLEQAVFLALLRYFLPHQLKPLLLTMYLRMKMLLFIHLRRYV